MPNQGPAKRRGLFACGGKLKEVPVALVKAGITLAVVAASPFVAKAATSMADNDKWQWWNKDDGGKAA